MIRDHELTMLYDSSLCIGCNACTLACKEAYSLKQNVFRTGISERKTEDTNGKLTSIYYKNACLHCTDASCIMACPTGACYRNENGLVVIDDKLCISCNYCVKNCPYNAIIYDKASGNVEKCTLCKDLYDRGVEPFCSQACPQDAIKFGPREEILEYARSRVKDLKSEGYNDSNIYGEYNYGGQRVMAVLTAEPIVYGLKEGTDLPLMLQNFDAAPMKPFAFVAAGLVLGFNFIHSRKYKNKSQEVKKRHHGPPFTYIPPGQDEGDDIAAIEDREKDRARQGGNNK